MPRPPLPASAALPAFAGLLVFTACLAAGCEDGPPPPSAPLPVARPADRPDAAWNELRLALPPDDPGLAAAVTRARATADAARKRWAATAPEDRADRWAVKWAAVTTEGTVEHVWVMPVLAWSPHRIEGRLASAPHQPLLCGREAGEPVSLAAADLSDWVEFRGDGFDGPREGGFTIDAIVERYGEPERDP